jgi:hypothetical protein
MLWIGSIVLLLIWLLGMVSSYTLGGFIHLILLLSFAFAIAAIASRRRAVRQSRMPPAAVDAATEPVSPAVSPSGPSGRREPVPRGAPPIFLSYRREDSADVVGRIFDRLVQRFGQAGVFKDVDSIRLGIDFREHLRAAVGECRVLLAVVGPTWADATDKAGGRRLDDEKDYVRIEIEAAFSRGIPVIPVLVRNAVLPGENQLPGSLGPLAFRNGIAVRSDPDFHTDMDRLIAGLETLI